MRLLVFCVTMIALGLFLAHLYFNKEPEQVAEPAPSSTLGAPPPSDVGRNAKAAREYSVRQVCLADCTSEARTCSSTAAEQAAIEACASAKTACEGRCPSDAR